MKNNLRLAVALGGRSARAAAYVGVLKVLEEQGLKSSILSGTSSGAFIAAPYAIGYSAKELEQLFLDFKACSR